MVILLNFRRADWPRPDTGARLNGRNTRCHALALERACR
ncbi:hypothetical protein ACS15_4820 [Ralstonia insidiosa]|uniref:Uncharacterized protein n=1 Tax=Ralstonia insidiosa TaxID=190721 RepID=A0AAC9BN74_9RALS|nr:hypothetical protein ACS15_4820 [Ralstonia insidiosa]